ncbi:hypothetical protein [Nocardia sp. NBC_01388]|uniref:hypothetical protein n=1 Tax=Nocardia sp. NBC_01388 TaxID=2903596 RepID=UPI00324324FE
MTDPGYLPDKASVPQWKNDLLRRVHDLAADFVRIESLGADGYDGTDSDATSDWLDHLDALTAVRESTERIALSVGIPQPWIERARDVGAGRTATPGHLAVPEAPSEAKQFYLDMLSVDLWNLQRMAVVAAARAIRLTEGYEFGRDPLAGRDYQRNMDLLHARISALADAAGATVGDAENLWGTAGTENLRRATAATVNGWDDLTVEFAWRQFARPSPDAALPPYIPVEDPAAEPVHRIGVRPPTPEQLVAQATGALRATRAEPNTMGHQDIETAIDVVLPAEATWGWGFELPESAPVTTEPPHGIGPEP